MNVLRKGGGAFSVLMLLAAPVVALVMLGPLVSRPQAKDDLTTLVHPMESGGEEQAVVSLENWTYTRGTLVRPTASPSQ